MIRTRTIAVLASIVAALTLTAAALPREAGAPTNAAPAAERTVGVSAAHADAEINRLRETGDAAVQARLDAWNAAVAQAHAEEAARIDAWVAAVHAAEAQAAEAARITAWVEGVQRAEAEAQAARSRAQAGSTAGGGWAALRACESGGNYGAVSSSGTYRGAYQFSRSTWNSVAGRHHPHLVGVDPAGAAPADQDAMAASLYKMSGSSPWPHCGRHLR